MRGRWRLDKQSEGGGDGETVQAEWADRMQSGKVMEVKEEKKQT